MDFSMIQKVMYWNCRHLASEKVSYIRSIEADVVLLQEIAARGAVKIPKISGYEGPLISRRNDTKPIGMYVRKDLQWSLSEENNMWNQSIYKRLTCGEPGAIYNWSTYMFTQERILQTEGRFGMEFKGIQAIL